MLSISEGDAVLAVGSWLVSLYRPLVTPLVVTGCERSVAAQKGNRDGPLLAPAPERGPGGGRRQALDTQGQRRLGREPGGRRWV